MKFDPVILNFIAAGFGAYLCYRVLRQAKRAGRRIKRSVSYWLYALIVLLNVAAIVGQKIGG